MRKFYLTLISVLTIGIANAQTVPNWGFENWFTDTLYIDNFTWTTTIGDEGFFGGINDYVNWGNDAQDGDYSIYLETFYDGSNDDTNVTYIFQGQVGTDGPSGGINYNYDIDSLTGYYKCDVGGGDSAQALLFLYTATDTLQLIYNFGGTVSTWTYFSFPIDTFGSGDVPPEEVFLGFTSSNILEDSLAVPGSWLMVDNVSFKSTSGTPAALPDYSFEDWYLETYEKPEDWWTLDEVALYVGDSASTFKSSDAFMGTFSIQLVSEAMSFGERDSVTGDPVYTDTIGAALSGNNPPGDEGIRPSLAYSAIPHKLTGFYKTNMIGQDSAGVGIAFYLADDSDTLSYEIKLDNATDWAEFSIDLTGINKSKPWDSISVFMISSSGDNKQIGSEAWFDEVRLVDSACGYTDTTNAIAEDTLNTCNNGTVSVDLTAFANVLWQDGNSTAKTRNLSAGEYIVRTEDGNGCYSYDLVAVVDTGACNTDTSGNTFIAENKLSGVEVYPNPGTSKVFINNGAGSVEIEKVIIYNLLGEQLDAIVPDQKSSEEISLDISDLSRGVYILKIVDFDGVFISKRFVKE